MHNSVFFTVVNVLVLVALLATLALQALEMKAYALF